MSEPFLERLSRFTPDASGLDRDSLLFEAGRASARPNRGWKCLSAVLATTQLLALAVLWPQAAGIATNRAGSVAQAPPQRTAEPSPSESPAASGVWSIRHESSEAEFEERLTGRPDTGELVLVESEPILRAFGPLPASVVN
jgi:hypothetical protein